MTTYEMEKTGDSNPLAVIHNDLVRASYDMSVNELRLLFIVLSQLPKKKEEPFDPNKPFYVTKEDFVRLGVEPKNVVREIRTACKLMRKKEFRIDTPLGELVYPIFDSVLNVKDEIYTKLKDKYPDAKYDDKFINELRLHNLLDVLDVVTNSDTNIVVRIVIHNKVLPYLVKLEKHFTKLYLKEFFTFSSPHSFRLYFIMMQFRTEGKSKWWCKVSLKDLRKALMLDDKYKANKDFKKWVIDKAIDEINAKSPIKASCDMLMTGKRFTHVVFNYELKEKPKPKDKTSTKPKAVGNSAGSSPKDLISKLSSPQMSRLVHSRKFIGDYGSMVSSSSPANQSSNLWIETMVKRVLEKPEDFTKRPLKEYLDDEQHPRF